LPFCSLFGSNIILSQSHSITLQYREQHHPQYNATSTSIEAINQSITMAEYITNPEKWLKEITEGNDFVAIIIFRGSWDKYDKHYLQKLGKFNNEKIKNEGLKLIAWTSEGPEGAAKADAEWGLTKDYGFSEVLGDETNALSKYLVDDCILEGLTFLSPAEANVEAQVTPGTYPNGICMPGMIWYAHHGSLVLQWESKVEAPDFGGPNRPHPQTQACT
jgi:hypothetical protein